ncbi:helicase C-terminal domain-containing protein [Pseudomonas aeruginosa]
MARWLTLAESGSFYDIEANASPILAAETLRRNLWNVAYGVLVTSATPDRVGHLRPLPHARGPAAQRGHRGGAEPPSTMPRPGVLRVPTSRRIRATPPSTPRRSFAVPELVKGARGSLVLFSSRKQMQEVFDGLDRDWRKRVFIQGNLSKQETLNKHKSRVDDGERQRALRPRQFRRRRGPAGGLGEHVVIAKIPFAVPDDPVEAALAEWIEARGGTNPFMEIAVPDASLRLVQACGAMLLRTEQDRGTITLLDRRVVAALRQGYPQCIAAVPPGNRLTRWPAREGASLHVRSRIRNSRHLPRPGWS